MYCADKKIALDVIKNFHNNHEQTEENPHAIRQSTHNKKFFMLHL